MKNCLNCGKQLTKTQTKYCCQKCQLDFQYFQYIERWKKEEEDGSRGQYQVSNYIKRYMFERANYKCEKCGWGETNPFTGKIPLEIDHIDGNYMNNKESNLQVLCPNCHSLTSTYKGANKGNGRKDRHKYNLPV